jgi:aspartate kinase
METTTAQSAAAAALAGERSTESPIVVKFGGTSLERPDRVASVLEAVEGEGAPVVVVASARAGVTDALLAHVERGAERASSDALLALLRSRHPGDAPAVLAMLDRLRPALAEIARPGDATPAAVDLVLSYGERLSVAWLAAELGRQGRAATAVEADALGLRTDARYGRAELLLGPSRTAVRARIESLLRVGRTPVVTGFFGRSPEGRPATLGRGGSDYTATALGALLDARRVDLVKQAAAVLTADPRLVPAARPIPRLSYEEAEELAQFGAGVLHPRTIESARAAGIPIQVRPLSEPDRRTLIGPRGGPPVPGALTLLGPLSLFRMRRPGGGQSPGILAEIAEPLARAGISLVQVFTSSALVCLLVERHHEGVAARTLGPLAAGAGALLEGPFRVALVTAIGEGVLQRFGRFPPGAFVGAEGLSATPRSVALAVPAATGPEVLRELHRALVEEASA